MSLTDHDAVAGVPDGDRGRAAGGNRVRAGGRDVVRPPVLGRSAHARLLGGPRRDRPRLRSRPAGARQPRPRDHRAAERATASRSPSRPRSPRPGAADSIGRPHIARAAGAGPDLGPFFEEYLVPGAKAFVPRRWPSAEEAVELIHAAGGAAVVAHPYWDVSEPSQVRDLVVSLKRDVGLEGIETFYPPAHEGADGALPRALRRARPRSDRLLGLPRPHAQDVLALRRLRHVRPGRAAGAAPAVSIGT